MKVLLIKPLSESHYFVQPIGLGYLATSLRKENFKVGIIDGVKDNLTLKKLRYVLIKNKPEVVGISFFSCDFSMIKKYCKVIKATDKNIILILGGPHVTGVKEEIFDDFPLIDFAFAGEIETVFPQFLKKVQNKKDYSKTPGLIFRKKGKIVSNAPVVEEDLDKLGIPAWDLMDPRKYPKAPQGAVFRNWPIAPIMTARGCPYQCTYCAGKLTTGQRIRKRSIANIMEEVDLLYNEYGIREIHIIDDTFTTDKQLVKEFCTAIRQKGIKISLTFPNGVRLNNLDDEILSWLKGAGCYAVSVGIESGSQKILNDMKKGLTLGMIREKTKLVKKYGIDMNGFFIVGYPTENKQTILETIKFAKSLPLKRAHFSTFLPLPGTEATRIAQEMGLIKKIEWDKLFYTDAPCPPKGMTAKELKKLQRKAFLKFYLRPKQLFWLLMEIRSFDHFKALAKRSIDYAIGRQ